MSLDSLYNQIVNVIRGVTTTDELGGNSATTWTPVYSLVKCRFNSLASKEMLWTYDKKTVFADYVVYMNYLSGVQEGDRLVKIDDGSVYDVKLIVQWDMALNYLRLAVVEVR